MKLSTCLLICHGSLALLIALASPVTRAGAIARQFSAGYDGVSWGISLAELVEIRPGGYHYFAVGEGDRDYTFSDEKALFGIPRNGMRTRYYLDDTASVVSAGVMFPYEQLHKLLGTMILSFGPYQRMVVKGISTYYFWPRDDGMSLVVRATLDPSFGMLEMTITGPNIDLEKRTRPECAHSAMHDKK